MTAVLPAELLHGRRWTYIKYRCRCEACRAANTDYLRAQYAQRPATRRRRLEVRIGSLIGPPEVGGDRRSDSLRRDVRKLSHHERHDFRKMAADPEAVEEEPWLPVEPLHAALQRHCAEAGGGLHSLLSEAQERAWYRARRTGRISVMVADRLCVEALRLHPSAVWGATWYALDAGAEREDTGAHG